MGTIRRSKQEIQEQTRVKGQIELCEEFKVFIDTKIRMLKTKRVVDELPDLIASSLEGVVEPKTEKPVVNVVSLGDGREAE